jgi:hypothetical protein
MTQNRLLTLLFPSGRNNNEFFGLKIWMCFEEMILSAILGSRLGYKMAIMFFRKWFLES